MKLYTEYIADIYYWYGPLEVTKMASNLHS